MQWMAILVVLFLILGLRRSETRVSSIVVVIVAAAVLSLWYAQMSPK